MTHLLYVRGGLRLHVTGPAFIQGMYNEALAGRSRLDHVFFYETTRNYIFPEVFTAVMEYSLTNAAGQIDGYNYGWVNQGFIDVAGCLFSEAITPPVEFYYYGQNRKMFMDSMEGKLNTYMANSSYTWDNVWMKQLLPWDQWSSLDNLYAGLLVHLYRNYGGYAFLRGMWRAIPGLLDRVPGTANNLESFKNNQRARDNFFIAASQGAGPGVDLLPLFRDRLRWNISQAAVGFLRKGEQGRRQVSPTTEAAAQSCCRLQATIDATCIAWWFISWPYTL